MSDERTIPPGSLYWHRSRNIGRTQDLARCFGQDEGLLLASSSAIGSTDSPGAAGPPSPLTGDGATLALPLTGVCTIHVDGLKPFQAQLLGTFLRSKGDPLGGFTLMASFHCLEGWSRLESHCGIPGKIASVDAECSLTILT